LELGTSYRRPQSFNLGFVPIGSTWARNDIGDEIVKYENIIKGE
jgi:hypothetical protein